MSADSVKQIVARAVNEPEFRNLLFHNPGQALSGYPLTEAEATSLSGLTSEHLDEMAIDLEERLSRSTFGFSSFAGGENSPGPSSESSA